MEAERRPKKLIEAARDAVDGGKPPPELVLAWNCERWNALPETGGMLDQDWRLIVRMNTTQNVYNTMSHLRNLKGDQIHSLTSGERKILTYLRDEGLLYG